MRRALSRAGAFTALAEPTKPLTDELVDGGTASEPWAERALCAQIDPELWFPEKGESTRPAKRVCLDCEVREDCLRYALEHGERFGVWGGLSACERRALDRESAPAGHLPVRACIECGQRFSPNYKSTRVCSNKCRDERKRARS